eukprot:UN10074
MTPGKIFIILLDALLNDSIRHNRGLNANKGTIFFTRKSTLNITSLLYDNENVVSHVTLRNWEKIFTYLRSLEEYIQSSKRKLNIQDLVGINVNSYERFIVEPEVLKGRYGPYHR